MDVREGSRLLALAVVLAALAGCSDASPAAPEVAPEAPRFALAAGPQQIDLTRLAVEDLRLRVLPALEDGDARFLLERSVLAVEGVLAAADAPGVRRELDGLVEALGKLDGTDPALAAELDVIRLTVSAGNDIVEPIAPTPASRRAVEVW